ncbi:hypothetical protein HDU96_001620 [Phlyctochytrium bullatum]|nr:hypothetical protein HDU96_001620 [Phlyctochytrium bullatum]
MAATHGAQPPSSHGLLTFRLRKIKPPSGWWSSMPTSFDALVRYMLQNASVSRFQDPPIGLRAAIACYTDRMNRHPDFAGFDFYRDLLPSIVTWATDPQFDNFSLPILSTNQPSVVTFTSQQARFVLANTFLLNNPAVWTKDAETSEWVIVDVPVGVLSLYELYTFGEVAIERLLCLLGYFHRTMLEDSEPPRTITVERVNHQGFDWASCTAPIDASKIRILRGRMEDSSAPAFVDFANKRIHIHCIMPSCTQEEVLFSCCPEAFLVMAIAEILTNEEAVVIRNVRRFVDYTGYLDSFQYNGFYGGDRKPNPSAPADQRLLDILVLDAVSSRHFTRASVDRDMGKARLAFETVHPKAVVTGHWGCGVFGGHKVHKFLQQVAAAAAAGTERLDYTVFHDDALANRFERLKEAIGRKRWTVAELYFKLLNLEGFEDVVNLTKLFEDNVRTHLESNA